MTSHDARLVLLELNNTVFHQNLLDQEKHGRHSALETLKRLRRMSWAQVYGDQGLKWEKIGGAKLPPDVSSVYSLRITRGLRATAYREGDTMRFLTIPPDHDSTYRKQ